MFNCRIAQSRPQEWEGRYRKSNKASKGWVSFNCFKEMWTGKRSVVCWGGEVGAGSWPGRKSTNDGWFVKIYFFLVRTTKRHTRAKFFSSGLWHSQTQPKNVPVWLGHRNPLRCDPLPTDVWESSTVQRSHVVRDDATSRILGTRLPGGRRRTWPSLRIRQSGTYLLSPAHIKV